MNDLRRELAPVADEAWSEIETEARRTLKAYLAARKLVEFDGPKGWPYSAANTGRARRLEGSLAEGVQSRLRVVQPLFELRVPFQLARDELDDVSRGAADPDLDPVVEAACNLALAEDRAVFYGHSEAGMTGICDGSTHNAIRIGDDYTQYPRSVANAIEQLREAGVAGPYAIALGPECYNGLATTVEGGYPVIKHVRRLLDGPIVWAPALDGALVLSQRGGDFQLVVGRDVSIGYLDHDRETVTLYLEESLTFRLLTPEAGVPLRYER